MCLQFLIPRGSVLTALAFDAQIQSSPALKMALKGLEDGYKTEEALEAGCQRWVGLRVSQEMNR